MCSLIRQCLVRTCVQSYKNLLSCGNLVYPYLIRSGKFLTGNFSCKLYNYIAVKLIININNNYYNIESSKVSVIIIM